MLTVQPGADAAKVAATISTWPDVTVYSTQQQVDLLLSGMVDKARRQLGLFRVLLIIISTIIMALIIYTLTLDKIHDIAMLKLMGARNRVIVGLILQQALLIGALGYGLAYWLGTFAFPKFPRLVVIETPDLLQLAVHRAGHFRARQPDRHRQSHARRTEQGVVMTATANNTPAVEAIGLTKIYGSGNTEVVAMKDVSLKLARGEVVALLGPSGAGKSTFLTAIGLINPPTSGRIVLGGEAVMDGDRALVDVRAYRRQHLGFVFQKANLIPFLNAVENVAVAMEINDVSPRAARKRAMELLDYLGVADRANNLPDALSGGQQQRVAVARALANQPSLILADEPTAALDSHRGRQVMELFRKVAHERGSAVIVVTHDHRSLDVFDRTYEMEDGRVAGEVASGILPDVEGGILPPGKGVAELAWKRFHRPVAAVLSAGLGGPALRQARMPAATENRPAGDIANRTVDDTISGPNRSPGSCPFRRADQCHHKLPDVGPCPGLYLGLCIRPPARGPPLGQTPPFFSRHAA